MKSKSPDTLRTAKQKKGGPAAGRTEPTVAEDATTPADDICHLLQLPRELRDLIWEHTLLATHAPPALSSSAQFASAYRLYDSWGEEANHYPRSTRVNSTALLCCSHQINAEVSDAVARLRTQRRLACSLRILLRNEKYLFIDWTCVPAVATHYDAVLIDLKILGKPQPTDTSSSRDPWPSLLYDRTDRDMALHRHLFKLLARLRNYGPSFLGDPVIFSAISSNTSNPASSSPHMAPPPPAPRRSGGGRRQTAAATAAPRAKFPPSRPTTFTTLAINVLSPPGSTHTTPDPAATNFRPPLYPWRICSSLDHVAQTALVRRQKRSGTGLVQPSVVAAFCREFFAWALHARSTTTPTVLTGGGQKQRGENAFLKEGFKEVRVLLDGDEEEDLRTRVRMMEGTDVAVRKGTREAAWWEPVFKDQAEAFACDDDGDGGGENYGEVEEGGGAERGLHRYCRVTRLLRMRCLDDPSS